MKTAMQELMEWFYSRAKYNETIKEFEIMVMAEILLNREREQIYKAYEDGADHGMDVVEDGLDYVHSTEYFNQTYTK